MMGDINNDMQATGYDLFLRFRIIHFNEVHKGLVLPLA
jgi:hypothetical protein